jgi:EAL domain-containing protein (putative c-di-GMP-specific phosphodiesterase class I)
VPFSIGRAKNCNLTLGSKGISRYHAQLNASGDMLWIHDSGSTNGTFINGKQIARSEALKHGDIIHIGQVGFCVLIMEQYRLPDNNEDKENTVILDSADLLPDQLDSYTAIFKKMIYERAVVPQYQPVMKLANQRIKGYEILGRLASNLGLPSNPVDLFNLAVLLDMESELSSLFREEGVYQGQRFPEITTLFVNTHLIEFVKIENLKQSLIKIHELAVSTDIVLEINEKAITNLERMKSLTSVLKNLGIGLAYDNFGVRQSRLIDLVKFPPDFLKFHNSLIHNIHLAPKEVHQRIVKFLAMAQDLGAATIAEGIECKEEEETCRQLGFDYAQGNFYGTPRPISRFDLPQENNSPDIRR